MSDKKIKLLTIIAAVFGPLLGFILIRFNAPESVFDVFGIVPVVLGIIAVVMFIVFAWQKRKVATKEEKHVSYEAILSSTLVGLMCLNSVFSYSLDSVLGSVFFILLGALVIVGWNRYMRLNPDLSNQKFHLIYFLGLLHMVLGCFSLVSVSDINFNTKMILFTFISVGIIAFYAFQNIIFRR